MKFGGKYYLELVQSEIALHRETIGADFAKAGHEKTFALLNQLTGMAMVTTDPFEQQLLLLAMHGLYQLWLPLIEKDG